MITKEKKLRMIMIIIISCERFILHLCCFWFHVISVFAMLLNTCTRSMGLYLNRCGLLLSPDGEYVKKRNSVSSYCLTVVSYSGVLSLVLYVRWIERKKNG